MCCRSEHPTPDSSNTQQNSLNGPESPVAFAQISSWGEAELLRCFLLKLLRTDPRVWVCCHLHLVGRCLREPGCQGGHRGRWGGGGRSNRKEARTAVKPQDQGAVCYPSEGKGGGEGTAPGGVRPQGQKGGLSCLSPCPQPPSPPSKSSSVGAPGRLREEPWSGGQESCVPSPISSLI